MLLVLFIVMSVKTYCKSGWIRIQKYVLEWIWYDTLIRLWFYKSSGNKRDESQLTTKYWGKIFGTANFCSKCESMKDTMNQFILKCANWTLKRVQVESELSRHGSRSITAGDRLKPTETAGVWLWWHLVPQSVAGSGANRAAASEPSEAEEKLKRKLSGSLSSPAFSLYRADSSWRMRGLPVPTTLRSF